MVEYCCSSLLSSLVNKYLPLRFIACTSIGHWSSGCHNKADTRKLFITSTQGDMFEVCQWALIQTNDQVFSIWLALPLSLESGYFSWLKGSVCQKYNMKYIYSTSQMSKLSLTLHTFSVTGLVAGLFLTLITS